ncbi:hypothetical protein [Amycolatopsis eburnea]|nr:hypothetical protein [Amycolatopsis eburnea]
MRALRTVAYWIRYALRPSSVHWTMRDNDDWEYACGWETEEDA